jgi:serine/threonine protein kinase
MSNPVLCPSCFNQITIDEGSAVTQMTCDLCGALVRVSPSRSVAKLSFARVDSTADPVPELSLSASDPQTIGPYEVKAKLGEGSFGVVYRARDASLNRDVAIKVLRGKMQGSQKVVERFRREAEAAARMLHGNIVPVFQLGENDGGYYIVSAFISGQPLSELIPPNGMEPIRAVRLILQLLDALSYAHEQGIMHRDVKPANALIDDRDHLYLADFGLAGWIGSDQGRMTDDGAMMGTPTYMAPEQARGDIQQMGIATDQYSAGVILYELLTGHVPFTGRLLATIVYHVLHSPPPAMAEFRLDVDPQLEQACQRALAKSPTDRYPSCRAFADVLQQWLHSQARPAPTDALPVPPSAAVMSVPPSVLADPMVATVEAVATACEPEIPCEVVASSPPKRVRRSWLPLLCFFLAVALVLTGGYFAVWFLTNRPAHPTADKKRPGFHDTINRPDP